MSYLYDYASLGNSCQTSMDSLVSNKKYLPLAEPAYTLPYTRMSRYPGHYDGTDYYPEKTEEKTEEKGPKTYTPLKTTCCGN